MNIWKSEGPDGIHPLALKNCQNIFGPLLSDIFKKSLNTGAHRNTVYTDGENGARRCDNTL